jgi:GDP-D-mannose 3',5'-epimerase
MFKVCVTGASGFIGWHLCKRLKEEGCFVRGIDNKRAEFEPLIADEFQLRDLRYPSDAAESLRTPVGQFDAIFNLAADMGGIGYISGNRATISRNNTLINVAMLDAANQAGAGAFIFSSSACVYPTGQQSDPNSIALKEHTAWPAEPEAGYGLEKLYAEKLCEYYREEFSLNTQVVRFHNVAGPIGSWRGGREKAPAAACRKVIEAADGGSIQVWGDGLQSRSFMYVDDCVEGLIRIWKKGLQGPINLGTSEAITINRLHTLAIEISGKKLTFVHDLSKPQGVRGRNSDNTLIKSLLNWEPVTPIEQWLVPTYKWIEQQVAKKRGL